MALPVLIFGKSSSGKTYSLKNFDPDEIGIISVEKHRMPFKSDLKIARIPKQFDSPEERVSYAALNRAKYAWIEGVIAKAQTKSIAIDDSQFLLVNEMFDRSGEKGYDKFTEIAHNFQHLIHFVNDLDDENKIVYFLHHSEDGSDGRQKCKTIGRMLDEKLIVESLFDVAIYCEDHKFYTQANETSTAKTPEGMFSEIEIPNDLKAVDTAIRAYYGMNKNNQEAKNND